MPKLWVLDLVLALPTPPPSVLKHQQHMQEKMLDLLVHPTWPLVSVVCNWLPDPPPLLPP